MPVAFRKETFRRKLVFYREVSGPPKVGRNPRIRTFIMYVFRRGRLVAYGARLESVLGASPRGFESLSLRQEKAVCIYTGGFLLTEEKDLNPGYEGLGCQRITRRSLLRA